MSQIQCLQITMERDSDATSANTSALLAPLRPETKASFAALRSMLYYGVDLWYSVCFQLAGPSNETVTEYTVARFVARSAREPSARQHGAKGPYCCTSEAVCPSVHVLHALYML